MKKYKITWLDLDLIKSKIIRCYTYNLASGIANMGEFVNVDYLIRVELILDADEQNTKDYTI